MSRAWIVRTVYAIAVELSRTSIGQVAVPDHVRVFGKRDDDGGRRRVRESKRHRSTRVA